MGNPSAMANLSLSAAKGKITMLAYVLNNLLVIRVLALKGIKRVNGFQILSAYKEEQRNDLAYQA
jgi:hypothetical protein